MRDRQTLPREIKIILKEKKMKIKRKINREGRRERRNQNDNVNKEEILL